MIQKIKSLLLENRTLKQTVFKNAFWLSFGNIVPRLIHAILIIYIARILGTAGYGVFSYVLSFSVFLTTFSDLGLASLLTRELVKKPEEISAYISTTFIIKLVIVAIMALFAIFAGPALTNIGAAKTLMPIVALLLIFDSLRSISNSITRSQNKMELEAMFNIITEIFVTGFGLAIVFLKPTASALIFGYAAASGVGFAVTVIVLRNYYKDILKNFRLSLVKPILSASWPFAIMGVFGTFMINIDILIIGWFRTASELGLYSAGQRIIQLLYIIPGLIGSSAFPIVTWLVRNDAIERIKDMVEKLIAGALALAIPISVGGIILTLPLITMLFGADYQGGALALKLLLITNLFVFPGTIIGNTIFAYNKQKIFLASTAVGVTSNVIFDFVLIPTYGIAGSAVATIIAQIIAQILNLHGLKKIINFKIVRNTPKIIIAAIAMGIITFSLNILNINVIANILISGAIYFLILYLLKEPTILRLRPSNLK